MTIAFRELELPLDGPRGLLLPDTGPGRRADHCRERLLLVAALTFEGLSIEKIADRLNVSRSTVRLDRRKVAYALTKAMEEAGFPAQAASSAG